MAKKAIGQYSVALPGPDGVTHTFAPGSTDYPDWAEKRMGEHCFEGGEDLFNEEGKLQAVIHHDAVVSPPGAAGPPPRAGRGSGVDAWREYADAHNVDYDEDASRDDIVAACEAADVPV